MERPLNFLWAFNRLIDGIGGKNVNLSIDVQVTIGMLLICLTTLPQIIVYKYTRWEVVDIYPVPIQLHQEVVDILRIHHMRSINRYSWQPNDITLLVVYPRGISTSNYSYGSKILLHHWCCSRVLYIYSLYIHQDISIMYLLR